MATTSPSKIILITGSNRGVGYGIARRLAARAPAGDATWTILLACRTKRSAEETIQKLRAEKKEGHASLEAVELDLKSDESIIAARKDVEARFGRLDVLINNAGMVERINDDKTNIRAHFVDTFSITVGAVILIMNEFLPLLKRSPEEPRIVNVASQTGSLNVAASTDYFLTDQMGYSVAKAALNRVTIDYKKLHPEVAFYLACPGYCKTFLNLYQGFKDPYDGAKIVEDLVVAETGKYPFGFYAFENGELLKYDW